MPELVGIARMAAVAPCLEPKRRVQYFELAARSYLARCDSARMPFRFTINPYRGCEFGCKYCYARYTHEFMEMRDPGEFERKIYAKSFNPARFREELGKLPPGEKIALGTATDPYQPAERRYGIMRKMLEVFASTAGFHLGITTKSDLITRDLDLLREIARRHYVRISMTVTTVDRELARLLEPMAPRPDLRLAAVRVLSDAGFQVVVGCAPVMPLINDSEESLDALARDAAAAGAHRLWANVLFLKPCAYQVFLPFLEERFPELVRKYRERYARAAYLRGSYPEMIEQRVEQVRTRHGLDRPGEAREPELWPQVSQLELFAE
ncbi:MAG TPA: radical SAM protein [Bryobacteraceae bacterium]|nr:radical SAM protein [Bryobacteraceae bacterium]